MILSDRTRGNPVSFYFMFYQHEGAYRLTGEGNGDQAVTAPVFDVLKGWGDAEIARQIAAARAAAAASP